MSASQSSQTLEPTESVSRDAGRYLLEVYFVSTETGGRVQTGELGERLDVRPASVTEMFTKLARDEFIEYQKHDGATLTVTGEHVAETLVWRYCVTERFLSEVLDAHVDRTTAYRIGFELPVEGVTELAELVDIPCMRACSKLEQSDQAGTATQSDA